jgi:hypothetical protein
VKLGDVAIDAAKIWIVYALWSYKGEMVAQGNPRYKPYSISTCIRVMFKAPGGLTQRAGDSATPPEFMGGWRNPPSA